MVTKPYNIFELDISNGLKALPVGTAGGYISLLEAPTNANVKIHLNEREADGIPLKAYHAIEATNIEQIFVTADAVADEKITIVQSIHSDSFKMITPASDVNVDEVTQIVKPVENGIYTADALTQLDKIMNPYQSPIDTYIATSSDSNVVLLEKTLTCDKLKIILHAGKLNTDKSCLINYKLDEDLVARIYNANGPRVSTTEIIEIDNVKGKVLKLDGYISDTNQVSAYIQEYTLKP